GRARGRATSPTIRSLLCLRPGARDLFFEHPPDVELELAELGGRGERDEIARVREGDLDGLLDASRLRRPHHAAVAEEERLRARIRPIQHAHATLVTTQN